MAADDPARIRNLILVGHGSVGKTSLAEALLLAGGGSKALGSTLDGTSSFDVEPEEQKHGHSMFSGFHHVEWKKSHVNLIDTPGAAAFVHDASNCLRAATTAVLVVSPLGETKGEDGKVLAWATELGVPRKTGGIEVQLVAEYVGAELTGQRFVLRNLGKEQLDLAADRDGPAGAIAFAYGRDRIAPGEATSAFLVFRKGGLE